MGDLKQSGKIDASSNTIPTSFGTGAGSLLISGLGGGKATLMIYSTAEADLKINYSSNSSTSAPSVVDAYLPSQGTLALADVEIGDAVYIASDSGSTITTGIVRAYTV